MIKKLLIALLLLTASPAAATTFFISAAGNDTNNGTTKTTPWLHAPGMTGCASNCSAHTPTSGDSFIFKGGESWGSTTLPWGWSSWSGSAGNIIYIGVDQTWFTGGSYTRPIITCSNTCKVQLNINNAIHIQIEGLEWTGLHSTSNPPGFGTIYAINAGAVSGDIRIDQNYFHGASVTHDGAQNAVFVFGFNGQGGLGGEFDHNVIDNSDFCTPPGPCTMVGLYGGFASTHDNFFGYMSNGMVGAGFYRVFGNTLTNIVQSPDNGVDHENVFEDNGSDQLIVYNNVEVTNLVGGFVDLQMAPNSGKTDYAFNNSLPNMDGVNMEQCYEGAAGTCWWFNNTAEGGPDSGPPSGGVGRNTGPTTSHVINQHAITSATGTSWWNGSASFVTNLQQSKSTANGQGYSFAQTFTFSPTTGAGSTVGVGTNETALCTTITAIDAAAGAACGQDTTYGVAYNATNHTITGQGRPSTNPRPAVAAWDIGAYQFVSSSPAASFSPTSLTFSSQTVGTTSAGQGVTLTNTGTATMNISSITIAGTNSGDFAQTNTCSSTLAASANCVITVTFTPTGAGSRTANVSVADDAPGSPQTVPLTGTGVSAGGGQGGNLPGVTINSGVTISQLPAGMVGTPYSFNFKASGGTPPYAWSINPMIPGVVLVATTGALNGTPKTAGTFISTYTVTDSGSPATTYSVWPSLTIASGPTVPYVLQPVTSAGITLSNFSFSWQVGSTSIPTLTFTVNDSTPCPPPAGVPTCHWPVTISNSSAWLGFSASSGSTSFTTTASLKPSALVPGTYHDTVVLTVPAQNGVTLSNQPVSIPVTLTVTAAPPPPPATLTVAQKSNTASTDVVTATIGGFSKGQAGKLTWTPANGAPPVSVTISHP